MRTLISIVIFFCFTACSDRQSSSADNSKIQSKDTVVKHDTIFYNPDSNWQKGFGLTNDPDTDSIWGNPVKFYISNPKCSPIAIDFYQGQFRPTDNYTTEALLSLVTTNDDNLRPFYRWCLNKTIQIQDGALAEYTGIPARKYAEKFTKEFFGYMDIDTTKEKYNDWVGAISYSGFYDNDDYQKSNEIRSRMTKAMKQSCKDCNAAILKRIDKFVLDCFP